MLIWYLIEKESYYGGMTINLKKFGENLNYYDINSSYPFIMKNYLNIFKLNPDVLKILLWSIKILFYNYYDFYSIN